MVDYQHLEDDPEDEVFSQRMDRTAEILFGHPALIEAIRLEIADLQDQKNTEVAAMLGKTLDMAMSGDITEDKVDQSRSTARKADALKSRITRLEIQCERLNSEFMGAIAWSRLLTN